MLEGLGMIYWSTVVKGPRRDWFHSRRYWTFLIATVICKGRRVPRTREASVIGKDIMFTNEPRAASDYLRSRTPPAIQIQKSGARNQHRTPTINWKLLHRVLGVKVQLDSPQTWKNWSTYSCDLAIARNRVIFAHLGKVGDSPRVSYRLTHSTTVL